MNVNTQQESAAPQYTEEDLRNIEKVRGVIKSLQKFIHGKKIYAKNNPTLTKFSREFTQAFKTYFQEEEELVLSIEQYSIRWRDEIVYENDKRDESLAFVLYKDGIGEVSIQNGVPHGELEKLVDLLRDEVHNFTPNEDIVTKLWRADFEGISYRVLDEYLVGEFGDGSRNDDDENIVSPERADHPDLPSLEDKGRVIVKPTTTIPGIDEYINELADASIEADTDTEREEQFQQMMGSFFTISSEELKICQEEISNEKNRDGLVWFLGTILEFTLWKENASAARDVSNVVESLIDHIVSQRRVPALLETLEAINRFVEEHTFPDSIDVFFKNETEKLKNEELLLALGRDLEKWGEEAQQVFQYYTLVGRRAVPTICKLMEVISGPRLHREACNTIAKIAKDDIPQIIDGLNMDNPRIAQDVVHLVRASGTDSIPKVVRELMHFPDAQVRAEAIQYLGEVGTPEAGSLLISLLDDEEKNVRMKTLAAVQDIAAPAISDKIMTIAFSKELQQKQMDEQEETFKALGKVAGEQAIPKIRGMLERKSFLVLNMGGGKDNKLLAIRALENITSPDSVTLLDRLCEDSNNLVKRRAQRALEGILDEINKD